MLTTGKSYLRDFVFNEIWFKVKSGETPFSTKNGTPDVLPSPMRGSRTCMSATPMSTDSTSMNPHFVGSVGA
jgi:hypothetical protein